GSTALVGTDVGLFRSTGGDLDTWSHIDVDLSGGPIGVWSIAYVGTSTWLLASEDYSANAGHLWRSTNDGVDWTEITSALGAAASDVDRMTLAAAGQRVYLAAANLAMSDQKDVFRSDDGGVSFTPLAVNSTRAPLNPTQHQPDLDVMHGQAWYNQMLVVDPLDPDVVFTGGNLSLIRSTDAGATWRVMTDWLPYGMSPAGGLGDPQYAHADWHAGTIAHFGGTSYFYGGNDGGVIRSTEDATNHVLTGAATWEDKLNRGMVTHLIYSVATGRERPAT